MQLLTVKILVLVDEMRRHRAVAEDRRLPFRDGDMSGCAFRQRRYLGDGLIVVRNLAVLIDLREALVERRDPGRLVAGDQRIHHCLDLGGHRSAVGGARCEWNRHNQKSQNLAAHGNPQEPASRKSDSASSPRAYKMSASFEENCCPGINLPLGPSPL